MLEDVVRIFSGCCRVVRMWSGCFEDIFTQFSPTVSLLPAGACGERGAGSRSDRSSRRRSLLHSPREAQLCFCRSEKKPFFINLIPSSAFHQAINQGSFFSVSSPGCFTPLITCKLFACSHKDYNICNFHWVNMTSVLQNFTEHYSAITGTPGRTSTDRSSVETLFDSIITSQELKRLAT